MHTSRLSLIAALAQNRVIGINNTLPWRLSADLKRFKALTMGHPIIMGRKTWESIGRPLPGRRNIVVTHTADYVATGCEIAHSLEEAVALAGTGETTDETFLIGGAALYADAMRFADRLHLTEIHAEVAGDAFFPEYNRAEWREVSREPHPQGEDAEYAFDFVVYDRI